jgi:hypothetical protein
MLITPNNKYLRRKNNMYFSKTQDEKLYNAIKPIYDYYKGSENKIEIERDDNTIRLWCYDKAFHFFRFDLKISLFPGNCKFIILRNIDAYKPYTLEYDEDGLESIIQSGINYVRPHHDTIMYITAEFQKAHITVLRKMKFKERYMGINKNTGQKTYMWTKRV